MPEIYGTSCPEDKTSRCFVKYSTNGFKPSGPGKVFVYCPYGKSSRAKNQLLRSREFDTGTDIGAVLAPNSEEEISSIPSNAIVDTRIMNERGLYTGRKSDGSLEIISVSEIEMRYLIGKAMCDKMSERGGRFMITSFYPMGDNYRWLARFDGIDYSDVSMVVTETAKDLPRLAGMSGFIMSRGDVKSLRMYLSMNYHEDQRFKMIPHKPLYPGAMFHGDIDTSFYIGAARRVQEPALSVVEPADVPSERLRRSGLHGPRSILLNPYGNSIEVRSEDEKKNTMGVMLGLAERLLGRGYEVYTNTPFPEQEELPGTKRYEGDIVTFMNAASGFDLVVTVFTGFMEVAMYADCNLVVLRYSDDNSRRYMAKGLGRRNYWEYNVLDEEPEALASRIMEMFDGLDIGKGLDYPRPAERLLSLWEKAEVLKGQEVTSRMMRLVLFTAGKGELRELVERGTDDPLLCCVGAKSHETGLQNDTDVKAAIDWYRKAYQMGVPWAKRRVVELKKQIQEN